MNEWGTLINYRLTMVSPFASTSNEFMISSSSKEKIVQNYYYTCVGCDVSASQCAKRPCVYSWNRCDCHHHFCQSIGHNLSERQKKYVVNKCDWIMRFSFCRIDRLTIRSDGFSVCANNASVHGSLRCTPVHAWHGATMRDSSQLSKTSTLIFVNDSQSPVEEEKNWCENNIDTHEQWKAWPLGSDVPFEIT